MKRILTVQDISCVGKCSLSVALPILSVCGIEASVLPTAVLSSHTAFRNFSFYDLTPQIPNISKAWEAESLSFDALYSGYLGNESQIETVLRLYDEFCNDSAFLFVDPVMADNGKLYSGFSMGIVDPMASLCSKADFIIPNISEACFLLHRDFLEDSYSENDIKKLLTELTELGCKTAIITGVCLSDDRVGVMSFNKRTNTFFFYDTEKLPVHFPGTGDVFASTVAGAMLRGLSTEQALVCAADFTFASIKASCEDPDHVWYGVNFESELPYLCDLLKEHLSAN